MIHFLLHHWILFVIVGLATLIFGWIFWEYKRAIIDPNDMPPRPYEEGIMGDIHNHKN